VPGTAGSGTADFPDVTDPWPELYELANAHGVATEFWDWQGRHTVVSAETIIAVLDALGVDASSREASGVALYYNWLHRWERMLPPYVVTRQGWTPWFWVHVEHGADVTVWVETEDGSRRTDVHQQDHWVNPEWVNGRLVGEATFSVPADLPLGYHRLVAQAGDSRADCPLIVTPAWVGLPNSLADGRAWGMALQLYSVRSQRSWGIGDLADLADLTTWAGVEHGAGFVLVNPLHAGEPAPPLEPSPYLPSTRRFVSPLYLRVESIEEYAYLDDAARRDVEDRHASVAPLNTALAIDRDAAWQAKEAALRVVHRVPRSPGREISYRAFLADEGEGLLDFATWCVLSVLHGPDWHAWPADLRDPRSEAVAAVRTTHRDDIDFYCWLQWVLDEQLRAVQDEAGAAGMPIGLMQDLAVGVHPDGADAWGLQEVLAQGITVGAPPDAFNQQGQNWSQPPWRPDRLAETGYAAYRNLLRTVLRHAGGLRVDHIIGLFRLWWIPAGRPPTEGAYIRYDHEALVGILALEAVRAGAILVGEDLGTVEPWVRDYLRERGVLGTSVLWFEYDQAGRPLHPEHWRELCLATVTTHDLPPTAGYLAGDHVRLRDELGLLTRSVDEEMAVDVAERQAWLDVLRDRGLLDPGASVPATVEALHRLLMWSPAKLIGVSLTDMVGDRRTQNQPGTLDQYPNWRVALSGPDGEVLSVEQVIASERAAALPRVVGGR
jgi:4-alpha-glucanotransferase